MALSSHLCENALVSMLTLLRREIHRSYKILKLSARLLCWNMPFLLILSYRLDVAVHSTIDQSQCNLSIFSEAAES